MNKFDFTQQVSIFLNMSQYDVIKKKHGNVPQIVLGELLDSVYEHVTIPKIADSFGVSVQTINRILRTTFPDTRLLGQRTWKYHFLDCLELRTCNQCLQIKSKDLFYSNNRGLSKKDSICKECSNSNRKEHIKQNPQLHKASGAKQRARKRQAIPLWADLNKIRDIYKNCPEGLQVDHIIPLQGETVCGLHVENNLQYLTKSENCKKSNKLLEIYIDK